MLKDLIAAMVMTALYDPAVRMVLGGVCFVVWVGGIIFCDRAAEEMERSQWVARIAAALLPILAPVLYRIIRNRHRRFGRIGR